MLNKAVLRGFPLLPAISTRPAEGASVSHLLPLCLFAAEPKDQSTPCPDAGEQPWGPLPQSVVWGPHRRAPIQTDGVKLLQTLSRNRNLE